MGLYWQTVFYNNVYDTRNYIVLERVEKIIETEDIERGYIDKCNLLKKYSDLINTNDIDINSGLIEYVTTMYDGIEKIKTAQLKVI